MSFQNVNLATINDLAYPPAVIPAPRMQLFEIPVGTGLAFPPGPLLEDSGIAAIKITAPPFPPFVPPGTSEVEYIDLNPNGPGYSVFGRIINGGVTETAFSTDEGDLLLANNTATPQNTLVINNSGGMTGFIDTVNLTAVLSSATPGINMIISGSGGNPNQILVNTGGGMANWGDLPGAPFAQYGQNALLQTLTPGGSDIIQFDATAANSCPSIVKQLNNSTFLNVDPVPHAYNVTASTQITTSGPEVLASFVYDTAIVSPDIGGTVTEQTSVNAVGTTSLTTTCQVFLIPGSSFAMKIFNTYAGLNTLNVSQLGTNISFTQIL